MCTHCARQVNTPGQVWGMFCIWSIVNWELISWWTGLEILKEMLKSTFIGFNLIRSNKVNALFKVDRVPAVFLHIFFRCLKASPNPVPQWIGPSNILRYSFCLCLLVQQDRQVVVTVLTLVQVKVLKRWWIWLGSSKGDRGGGPGFFEPKLTRLSHLMQFFCMLFVSFFYLVCCIFRLFLKIREHFNAHLCTGRVKLSGSDVQLTPAIDSRQHALQDSNFNKIYLLQMRIWPRCSREHFPLPPRQ